MMENRILTVLALVLCLGWAGMAYAADSEPAAATKLPVPRYAT